MIFEYLSHKKRGRIAPYIMIIIIKLPNDSNPFYLKGNLTTFAFTKVFLISIKISESTAAWAVAT